MSNKTYSVVEIDRLRKACTQRWLFGSTNIRVLCSNVSRPFNELEKIRALKIW